MTTDMMVKLIKARSSKPVAGVWRKLRTFQLVPGTFVAPNRAGALKTALEGAVAAAFQAVREALEDQCDEIVPETPQSSVCSSPVLVSGLEDVPVPSAPSSAISAPADSGGASPTYNAGDASEESFVRSSVIEIVNLVSSEEDRELQVASPGDQPSFVSDLKAATYMRAIPNRHARGKVRHQAPKKRAQWHVPRSRKRRHLAKRAITRSGNVIYHAKAFKPAKFEEEPRGVERGGEAARPAKVWPVEVEQITTCKRNRIKFPDIGSVDRCRCFGGCFLDTCSNVASASFFTPKYCKLGATCSNAPRTLDTLKLFDTGRVGLGVYTTTALDVGDVIREYCGELTEFAAAVEGQPAQARKHNSGYTMLYNAKSVRGKYVYVDALRCGSITRFLSHACQPNAAFVEQQTRSRVRVLVKMIKNVKASAQVTVHYGDEHWFKCACDVCWEDQRGQEESSEEE
ncbi:hypothetical protein L917_10110 [Phytophthora nicotianae]|uniref:SET domain-containing protein n=1 Tax=Phytophthora nicotianae TaxID=4792 RepID=W2L1G5_PHYNI|nr:hypothetical protein L917_10110 [Phytophthora nicotianae]